MGDIAERARLVLDAMNKKSGRLEQSLASALELVEIRDRRIELLVKEIELLKKLLASQKPTEDPYPKYDELTRKV